MPDIARLGAAAGFARGFGPSFAASSRQALEQEKKGKEEELTNLVKEAGILAELFGKDDPRYLQTLVKQYKLRTGVDLGGGREQPQRVQMPTVEPFAGRLQRAGAVPSPIMTRPSMREEARVTAQTAARIPKDLKPPSPGSRLVRLYDNAKKRFEQLDAELTTLKMTQTEPGSLLGTGFFSNQETIDTEIKDIAAKEKQVAKVKAYMDSTVAEGRRLYGERIVFETPTQVTPTTTGGLMTREEFIQAYINDPMNVQKMAPSEAIINQAKGVDWQ